MFIARYTGGCHLRSAGYAPSLCILGIHGPMFTESAGGLWCTGAATATYYLLSNLCRKDGVILANMETRGL